MKSGFCPIAVDSKKAIDHNWRQSPPVSLSSKTSPDVYKVRSANLRYTGVPLSLSENDFVKIPSAYQNAVYHGGARKLPLMIW